MAARYFLFLLYVSCVAFSYVRTDDIERVARKGVVLKLLREMVNQTKADTLNLPANASSIRENITDTFSCENRTYGYYADVDNECQLFHVCLTSETASGRNVTYRWSFICPNETIFNQEVLTCTRPRDAINCEDSPMFYHLNMDIGKIPNENDTQTNPNDNNSNNKNKRKPLRKQNLIIEGLLNEVKKDDLMVDDIDEELMPIVEEKVKDIEAVEESENIEVEEITEKKNDVMKRKDGKKPIVHEVGAEYINTGKRMENSRLAAERSLKRRGRKISRGSYKYKSSKN